MMRSWRCIFCFGLLAGCYPAHLDHEAAAERFMRDGRCAEAVYEYTLALQTFRSVDLLLCRAKAWEGLGRFDYAITDYDSVLRIFPNSVEGHMGRGVTRVEQLLQRNITSADSALRTQLSVEWILVMGDLNAAVELDPGDLQTYRTRAFGRFHFGDYRGTLTDLDRVLKSGPGDLWTYDLRGRAHQAVGDWQASTADFTRVIRYSPWDPIGYAKRGLGYLKSGQFPEAEEDLTRSLNLDSLDGRNWYFRALARMARGDVEGACGDACRGGLLGDSNAAALVHSLACECPQTSVH